MTRSRGVGFLAALCLVASTAQAQPTEGGPLPGPLPLFPADNWWNLDVSAAPLDPASSSFIAFIGTTRSLHPDLGGEVSPGSTEIYGMPYVVVDGTQPKKAVQFLYADESDGVDHSTGQSYPFYPIPDQAITQVHWIEEGSPGNVDLRDSSDRHLLIVDRTNRYLYELYNVYFDGTRWNAGSGAFFDLSRSDRRPDGWTSADAAGLAILPGLLRYDEVYGTPEIGHALRVTVRASNGHVYPASHDAGSAAGALPMGARLRLKAAKDISTFPAEVQKIFRAFKKYGLIVADNGSDMYVSGTFDTRWNNDVLNPAFASLKASDFEVVQLGYRPSATATATPSATARPTPTATRPSATATVRPTRTQTPTATATLVPSATPTVTAGRRDLTDFNGDGRTDLLWQYSDGSVGVWLMNGTTRLSIADVFHHPVTGSSIRGVGDFDADGQPDLVWQDAEGRVALWLMQGVSPRAYPYVYAQPLPGWTIRGVADLNGDGSPDLVWQHANGVVAVWCMQGTELVDVRYIGFQADWTLRATGDLNGDGWPDLVGQSSDGSVSAWLMNGTSVTSRVPISGLPSSGIIVRGAGDFNGDGRTDLVWQYSNGGVGAWLLSGTSFASAIDIDAAPQAGVIVASK